MKILILVEAFAKTFCPCRLEDESDNTALVLGRMWRILDKWTGC